MNEELLFEHSPHPMLVCNKKTLHIIKVNKRFSEKYKYSAEEVAQKQLVLKDLYHPKDLSKLEDHFKGGEQPVVWRHQSKEGDVFCVKVFLEHITYPQHEAILYSFVDITEQINDTVKAHKSFEELRHHVQNTALALIQWDSEFRITEWSPRAAEISGYTKDEVLGKTALFFEFNNEDAKSIQKSMETLQNGAIERDYLDVNIKDKTGKVLSIKINSSALRDMDDRLVSVLTLIEDYTEQKEAREKLHRSEQLFKNLFTKAPQAIVMVDPQNKVQQINKSFETLFGYSEEELTGHDIDKIVGANNGNDGVPNMLQNGFEKGGLYSNLTRYTKEGKEQDVIVGTIPVHLDGKLIAGFGIYIDITEQIEAQRRLKQSLDEKQVLLEEVHHRVKNNLAVVSGLLQMQTLHVNDKRLTQYIKNSQLRIQSMAIVHEMLYKSKKLSQIQMRDYVEKLTKVIAEMLGPDDKKIATHVESESIILNVNQAIPCALIISELISNAYTFAFEGRTEGLINISLSHKDDTIYVKVCDDGIGLPDNFEEMRKKSLGMSLVDNLCEQLDTRVDIESGDWGTCFEVAFENRTISGSSSLNRI